MAEEPAGTPTAEAPETTTEAVVEQPAAEPQAPEPVDWDTLQAQIDRAYEADPKAAADRLKKHRAIAGIAGSLAERRLNELRQQDTQERQAQANERAREELRKMAQDEPLKFADLFLSNDDAEQAKQRILTVEQNAAKRIMEQIGAAYHDIPEWSELSEDERAKLHEAMQGSNGDDALPRFNKAALDIVAARRAEKLLQDRLPKEQEAWKKQWEAERLTSEQGPDLRRATSATSRRVNWSAMSDEDFSKWWKQRYG